MQRRSRRKACGRANLRTLRAAGAAAAAWHAGLALAFPDGAPWDAAGDEGCERCHFDAPPVEASDALAIAGLPERVEPGRRYPLTLRLRDENAAAVGFLLSARRGDFPAGAFSPVDDRTEANGARARSTEAGSMPDEHGRAQWAVTWQAPPRLDDSIVLELWANAGNGDDSPFGDTTHVKRFPLAGRESSIESTGDRPPGASAGDQPPSESPRTTE